MNHQKVLLLGGYYGSGKTTLTNGLINYYGCGINLDFDNFSQQLGAFDPSQVMLSNEIRAKIWETYFPNAVETSIKAGNPLTIVAATFAQRPRRDRFMSIFDRYPEVDVYPLVMMLPMKETIRRIRTGRIGDAHVINDQTVLEFYRRANRTFRNDDHTDFLLPTRRSTLPKEYQALLTKKAVNKDVFFDENRDVDQEKRWVIVPHDLTLETLEHVIDGDPYPLSIRYNLEGLSIDKSIMDRGLLPVYARH